MSLTNSTSGALFSSGGIAAAIVTLPAGQNGHLHNFAPPPYSSNPRPNPFPILPPTYQQLVQTGHLLQQQDYYLEVNSSLLTGYTLFLAFVIDRLHHYLQKLITLRKAASTSREEVEKLQMENRSLREKEDKSSGEIKKLHQDIAKLREDMKKLKSESEDHERKASEAEAHVNALQKQSEELLLEYDRLLEDNQILQSQLHYKA
ncbi:B-cell receptor-associated protein 31-like [Lolium rigidum]|uniref:B-cell receptor-associated protein 31-like n=1 Tax=Lolium rigidum TaxID=89674 RepID=UPI001F5E34E1|nr:B-cell receptor-associated protein 31-like [Lolium rigidum]